ncbi:hypothetical protein, partial [Escherichia coli]|uniref:hypothetical protein n=1 Tax=Escherichia coli TaxID=562 RepID=UPI001BDC9A54
AQSRPSDKVWTYKNSNVVTPDDGGTFCCRFCALTDRHNAVAVPYIPLMPPASFTRAFSEVIRLVTTNQACVSAGCELTRDIGP